MRYLVITVTTLLSALLMVMGMLYIIDRKQAEKIGGKLVKVDYRFTREFS